MRFSTRIWILILAAILGLFGLTGVALVELRQIMMEERQGQLSALVDHATASLTRIHEREKSGELTREAAQNLARQVVGDMRKDDRYFWARGFSDDVNQMHPDPKRVGVVDKDNNKGDQYRAALVGKSIGFVMSDGTRPGVQGTVPKLYAVTHFKPWDWIVGYGAYVDDINTVFLRNAAIFLAICAVVICLVGILALRMSRSMLTLLGGEPHAAADSMRKIAGGDLSVEIPLKKDDKTSLMASLKFMQVKLKNLTTAIQGNASTLSSQVSDFDAATKSYAEEKTDEGLATILRAVKNLGKTADILGKSISRFKL
jgi:methyl-accepting chemotaxis protein